MAQLSESEEKHLAVAFSYAHQALAAQEVPVGCIFVQGDNVIAVGRNTVNETRNATRHAELNCIDEVVRHCQSNALTVELTFKELVVYVTVEPCIMCAAALYGLQVKAVVFGCCNDRFGGQSVFDVQKVYEPRTLVKGGFRAEEAMGLLKEFYKGTNPSAPLSKVKVKK